MKATALAACLVLCACSPPLQVTTKSGALLGGVNAAGVRTFLGIPYAAPPTGDRRWRPPLPAAPWSKPRSAEFEGSACPQLANGVPGNIISSSDEDCLTLNIWAPNKNASHLPVMVFIHGGGFVTDSGSDPVFDGTMIAQTGVILVTINYRVGQLGYLAHPALAAEDPHHSAGNYGLLDQQLALRWIQDNIEAFGGAPENVTIFGGSAGAMSVCAHLISPLSKGLFHRALQESGTCASFAMALADDASSPYASAFSLGHTFSSTIGCEGAADIAACLRSKSVDEVLATEPRTLLDLKFVAAHYMPNIDGWVLPASPWHLLQAGQLNAPASWIGGANRDDGSAFVLLAPVGDEADYEIALAAMAPGHLDEALALYPASAFAGPNEAYSAFITDFVFTCPARREAHWLTLAGVPAYLYQFSRVTPFVIPGLGAFHGSEAPYVFGNFVGFTPSNADTAFVPKMMGAWTHFATSGEPDPAWPVYTTASDPYFEFADTASAQTGLHASTCDAMVPWIDTP